MGRVTVLLTGVPQYVTLSDISCNLDRLFNTDDIGSFKIRDLPNHRVTNKRQIALDFNSGFEAMAAQEKLNGYQYELVNGREYTLHAKIAKLEEYMSTESRSPERWEDQDSWSTPDIFVNVSDGDIYRAHARLDAQLELLKKQKLILETEKEILRQKRRLKREYKDEYDSENEASTTKRSKSREHPQSSGDKRSSSKEFARQHSSSDKSRSKERGSISPKTEHRDMASKARELRSCSRERRSRMRERRSRTRERRSRTRERRSTTRERLSTTRERRSKTRERRSKTRERCSRTRERRSTTRERRSTTRECRSKTRERRSRTRERCSRTRERRSKTRERRSKTRERRSKTTERRSRTRERRSKTREHYSRTRASRSRSRETRSIDYTSKCRASSWIHAARDRKRSMNRSHKRKDRSYKSRSSVSREREYRKRSRSRSEEQSLIFRRRSRSRERNTNSNVANDTPARSGLIVFRRRSLNHRIQWSSTTEEDRQLAIMPENPNRDKSPNKTPADSHGEGAHTPPIENIRICYDTIKKKDLNIDHADKDRESAEKDNERANETENKKGRHKKRKDKNKEKKIHKKNKLAVRVEAITKDIMVLMLILLDDVICNNDIRISNINKELLSKRLEAIIQERVEPFARVPTNTDDEVLKKYEILFPKKDDVAMLKTMLDEIPKIVLREPQATVTPAEATKDTTYVAPTTDNSSHQLYCDTNSNGLELSNNGHYTLQEQSLVSANNIVEKNTEPIEIIEPKYPAKNKTELKTKEIVTTIDLDSSEKPVPRNPKFVLIIRKLGKDMNKVISNNKLQDQITPDDIIQVLRYILKDLVKGQGYMTKEEIMQKFRGIYPKNKDLIFVKNVIKDINDGKYPELGPNLDATSKLRVVADNDSEDDVIVIEKQCDVVIVADSDDDDVVKEPIQIIDLECEAAKTTTQNIPGSTNNNMSIPVRVTAGPVKHVPTNPGPLRTNPGNPYLHNLGPINPREASCSQKPLIMARTLLVNRGLDMPSLEVIRPPIPTSVKTVLTNPDSTKPVQACTSQTYLGPSRHGLANPVAGKLDPASTKPTPVFFKLQTKTKLLPPNFNPLKPVPGVVNPTPANPYEANKGTDLCPAKPGSIQPNNQVSKEKKIQQLESKFIVDFIVFKESRQLCEILKKLGIKEYRKQFFRFVKKVIKIRIERLLSETPNLTRKTAMERYRRTYSLESNVTLVRDIYKNALCVELPSKETDEIGETAGKDYSQKSNEVTAKVDQEDIAEKNSTDSLKITAITIMTSVNELITRTLADETDVTNNRKPGEIKENIKEEKELADYKEAVDNCKQHESEEGPQVTSITIMTSKAELFSLSEGDKTNESKTESTLDCKEGGRDFIDNKESVSEPNPNVITELEQGISESVPVDKTPVDDEDETIESIVKYVATIL